MSEASPSTRVPLNLVRGCVVATAPADVSRETLDRLRNDLLERVRETGARRVLVDVSAVALMDTEDFRALLQLVAAASLMGARTIMAGLQPGVVSALIELGVEAPALETALDIDDGFERLETAREQGAAQDGDPFGEDAFGDGASDGAASQDGGAA